ncbi:hypothetical protein MRX96_050905 [Rhipicephalus microplus]
MKGNLPWLYPSTRGRSLAPDRQPVDVRGDDKGRRSAVKDKRRRSVKHSAGRSHYEEVVDDRHSGFAARWLSRKLLPWFFTNGTKWPLTIQQAVETRQPVARPGVAARRSHHIAAHVPATWLSRIPEQNE